MYGIKHVSCFAKIQKFEYSAFRRALQSVDALIYVKEEI